MVGTMSITWWNCVRIPPASLMRFGHESTRPLRVPPKCEATCFVHWNGVSKAWACGRHVVVGLIAAELVDHGEEIRHIFDDAVRVDGEFIGRALHRAFAAAAVVAHDVDDQGIVELTQVADRIDDSADLLL